MSKTSFKKLTSLVLAVLMLFSVMAVSASAADISTASTGAGKTVYFDPGKAADGNPVWFAWTWDGGVSDSWSQGSQSGDHIVFNNIGDKMAILRMPTGSTKGDWNSCWNRTGDIDVSSANLVTFSDWSNNSYFTVTTGTYGGGNDPSDPTTSSSGGGNTSGDYYLCGYINGANYGVESDYQTIGDYHFVNGTLTTTFTGVTWVGVKTGDNNNWYFYQGTTGCTETSAVLEKNAPEKMFIPANVEVTLSLVENGDGTLTLSYTTGGENPTDPTDPSDPSDPTSPSHGGGGNLAQDKFAIVVYDAVLKADIGEFYIEGGVVQHEFDNNSYIFIRKYTGGVQYCLGSASDVFANPATFYAYNSDPRADTSFPKMSIGGGNHTIKLTDNGDGSYSLYIDIEPATDPTDPTTTPSDPTTTPSEPETDPYTAPTTAPVGDELNAEVKLNGTTVKTIPINDKVVEVTFNLKADKLITDGDIALYYDSNILKLAAFTAPNIPGADPSYYQAAYTNPCLFNFTGVNASTKSGIYDFRTEKAFVKAYFNVVDGAKGNAIINLVIKELDGLENEVTTSYVSNGAVTADGNAVITSLSDPSVAAGEIPSTLPEPTTQAPSTVAPTTQTPTTPEPTTQTPTTPEPTTQTPTTPEPTTQAPTTQAPTTQAPTTVAPTTQAPTTPQPVAKAPALTFKKKSIKAGSKVTLAVKNKGSNKVTFTSSNKKIATVTSKGVITGLQRGSVTITVKVGSKKLTAKVVVSNNPVAKIKSKSVSAKKTYTVKKGKKLAVKLYRKVGTINNKYTTSNKKIAKVVSKANATTINIKGIKVGKATIKIKVNGVRTLTIKVKVTKK